MIKELCKEFKKVLPQTTIILGGPEVSYETVNFMKDNESVDCVIVGEGEETFLQLIKAYRDKKLEFKNIESIVYRQGTNIIQNKMRPALNLDDIPFPYEDLSLFQNRIIYYETTRGCPYNCQYCLSSIEKGVRYRSLDRVKRELQAFLDAKVMQVKMVDRTFNCSKKHALEIWTYLMEQDNNYTNFHFEITADLLDNETIQFLSKARPGLFQFEVGVQTTNEDTISHIKRNTKFQVLVEKVTKIKSNRNIHQHLDLIAGLPGEDYESFAKSFNDVYALEPEQLQLGFLKVLKGSGLYYDQKKYGLVYRDKAPYEILFTNEVSYGEMLTLKRIEEMVEYYYNSGRFSTGIKYLEKAFTSPFQLYEALANYWERLGLQHINHSKLAFYDYLLDFAKSYAMDIAPLKYFLLFDLLYHEKVKKMTDWMREIRMTEYDDAIIQFYKSEDNRDRYLYQYEGLSSKQISRLAHIEVFPIDIMAWIDNGNIKFENSAILFNYSDKNPIINKATIADVTKFII